MGKRIRETSETILVNGKKDLSANKKEITSPKKTSASSCFKLTENHAAYIELMKNKDMVLALGAAGTGKTYGAIKQAVSELRDGNVDKIILSRPAVEAGESLGFLPGDINEKMAPYLIPLFDALSEIMGTKEAKLAKSNGTIEIAPLAYMRGRTLNNAFVIVDEAQNCTITQLRMLVTRLGWETKMVITGDTSQIDLDEGKSGLESLAKSLSVLPEIGIIRFTGADVLRHPLVGKMLAILEPDVEKENLLLSPAKIEEPVVEVNAEEPVRAVLKREAKTATKRKAKAAKPSNVVDRTVLEQARKMRGRPPLDNRPFRNGPAPRRHWFVSKDS